MDESKFWEIIELSRNAARSTDQQAADIIDLLACLPSQDIRDFDRLLGERYRESNRYDLWAAGYLINGGCSEDGFLYFCGWLILQGRDRFQRAVKNADSIAEWIKSVTAEEIAECEDLLYVANKAFERVTGEDMPADPWAKLGKPAGKEWDEDYVDEVLPALSRALDT